MYKKENVVIIYDEKSDSIEEKILKIFQKYLEDMK